MPEKALFTKEDFSLFTPDKWSDRTYNLRRREVQAKLRSLAEQAQEAIQGLKELALELGVEHPAIWNGNKVDRLEAFFMRPKEERDRLDRALAKEIPVSQLLMAPSPLYGHASIGLMIDREGLHVGFWLPYLAVGDRANFRKALEVKVDSVLEAMRGLGEEIRLRMADSVTEMDWASVEDSSFLLRLLDELEQSSVHRTTLAFVRTYPAEEVASDGDGAHVVDGILTCLGRLLPLYLAVSWSVSNDLIDVEGLLRQLEEQRKAAQEARAREEERKKEEERRRQSSRTRRSRPRAQDRDRGRSGHRAPKKGRGPAGQQKGFDAKSKGVDLAPGMRVKVVSGPFQGKVATVQQVVGTKAKLQIGLFEVEISVDDLVW